VDANARCHPERKPRDQRPLASNLLSKRHSHFDLRSQISILSVCMSYHVYILASDRKALYVGVTGNLENRLSQHLSLSGSEFAARYSIRKLVYFEEFKYVDQALEREKQIKKWRRDKKIKLIEISNRYWSNLAPAKTDCAAQHGFLRFGRNDKNRPCSPSGLEGVRDRRIAKPGPRTQFRLELTKSAHFVSTKTGHLCHPELDSGSR